MCFHQWRLYWWFPDSWPLAFSASRPTENEIFSQFPMLAADSWKLQPAFCPLETHLWPCSCDVCRWTVDYNQTLIKKDDFRLHMTLHRQQMCSIWPYSECLDWWMDMWCNIGNKRRCFRAPKPFFSACLLRLMYTVQHFYMRLLEYNLAHTYVGWMSDKKPRGDDVTSKHEARKPIIGHSKMC